MTTTKIAVGVLAALTGGVALLMLMWGAALLVGGNQSGPAATILALAGVAAAVSAGVVALGRRLGARRD